MLFVVIVVAVAVAVVVVVVVVFKSFCSRSISSITLLDGELFVDSVLKLSFCLFKLISEDIWWMGGESFSVSDFKNENWLFDFATSADVFASAQDELLEE